jgi:hypothetical protein
MKKDKSSENQFKSTELILSNMERWGKLVIKKLNKTTKATRSSNFIKQSVKWKVAAGKPSNKQRSTHLMRKLREKTMKSLSNS